MKARWGVTVSAVLVLVGAASGADERDLREPSFDGKPLRHWLDALKDPRPAVRRQAAQALAAIFPAAKEAVPSLLAALKDSEVSVRGEAAAALVKIDPRHIAEAQPSLIAALKDKDPEVRCTAAQGLGQVGAPARSAVPLLQATLKDTNRQVRREAAISLAEIDPTQAKDAVPLLMRGRAFGSWIAAIAALICGTGGIALQGVSVWGDLKVGYYVWLASFAALAVGSPFVHRHNCGMVHVSYNGKARDLAGTMFREEE
jgi:hypothetical protein